MIKRYCGQGEFNDRYEIHCNYRDTVCDDRNFSKGLPEPNQEVSIHGGHDIRFSQGGSIASEWGEANLQKPK